VRLFEWQSFRKNNMDQTSMNFADQSTLILL